MPLFKKKEPKQREALVEKIDLSWTPERIAEENAKREKIREDERIASEEQKKKVELEYREAMRDVNKAKVDAEKQHNPTFIPSIRELREQHESPITPLDHQENNSDQLGLSSHDIERTLRNILKKQKIMGMKIDRLQRTIEGIDIDEVDRMTMQKLHDDFANFSHDAGMYVRHKTRCNILHKSKKRR